MRELGRVGQTLGISMLIAVLLVLFYLGSIHSIKHKNEVTLDRLVWFQHLTISDYIRVITENSQFPTGYKNSILIIIPTVILLMVVTSVTPQVLIGNKGKFHNVMCTIFTLGILVPFQCIILPLYLNPYRVGLVNSSLGFVTARSGLQIPTSVLMVVSFIKTVPREPEEAVGIDGYNRFQTLWRIAFPLMKLISAAQAVLSTLSMWNDYNMVMALLCDKMSRTLPLTQIVCFNEDTVELDLAFVFFNMAVLPVLVPYLYLQKHVISGIISGTVKG